jgi:T1SS-143 domain-containing protein
VTSGGAAVYYHVVDSHTVAGSTQAGQVIFTVTLDPASGRYDFTLEHQIDHPAAGVDSRGLQFGYTVTDGDGDTASSSFTVTVNDDVPTAQSFNAGNTDENASIAIDLAGHFTAGADGAVVTLGTVTVTDVPDGVSVGSFNVALDPDGHTVTFDPGLGFDALAEGEQVTLHIPYTVTDGDGDVVSREVTLTITGANDAPVITASTGVTGSATEAGDLPAIDEADGIRLGDRRVRRCRVRSGRAARRSGFGGRRAVHHPGARRRCRHRHRGGVELSRQRLPHLRGQRPPDQRSVHPAWGRVCALPRCRRGGLGRRGGEVHAGRR